jgi:hypothetical protein
VAFLQLTVVANSLNGTLDVATLNGTQVQTRHSSFSGTVSGQSVTLTFSEGLGTALNVSGAVNGEALVLNFPQTNGEIASTTFIPSNAAAYNSALADLQSQAGAAVARQSQAAAARSQAAAQASAAATARVAQWTAAHWETESSKAAVTSASACVLTVSYHDVRIFVATGGDSVCSAAPQYGWGAVHTYVAYDSVVCVGTVSGVTIAVTDSGGQYYGGIACRDVNAGAFPLTTVS